MTVFREMRRKRQILPQNESIAIMEKATHGVLALLGDEGYPYAVPLSFVFHQQKIYFHCAVTGHKMDAIRRCDKASFCVVDQDAIVPERFTTHFRSVIAFGKVIVVDEMDEKLTALHLLGEKYAPGDISGREAEIRKDFDRVAVVRLDIEHLTGKEAIELTRKRE